MPEYNAPVGAPIWFDLMSSDPAQAAEFYHDVFGWQVEGPPNAEFGGYQNFTHNGSRVAGLSPHMEGAGPANVWSVYLHTADAAATAAAFEAAGGSIIAPPMAIGEEGTMLFGLDTAGAAIGFWQPGSHHGYTKFGEHGSPYWFECQSKDYPKSVEFYTSVVGARIEPVEGPPTPYGQVFIGDLAYSGIMDSSAMLPPEMPSFWQVYVTVDDVAATVAKVVELGGSVLMPAEDTPYGTLAAVTDPLGAVFCLGHPPTGR